MGKLLTVSIIVWTVVLAMCIQRAMYWVDVMDDIVYEPFSRPPGERSLTSEEIEDLNEADRKVGTWGTRAFAWGYFGFQALIFVWAWEKREDFVIGTRAAGL